MRRRVPPRTPARPSQEFPFIGRARRLTQAEVEWWERWLFWGQQYLGRDVEIRAEATLDEEAENAAQHLIDGDSDDEPEWDDA